MFNKYTLKESENHIWSTSLRESSRYSPDDTLIVPKTYIYIDSISVYLWNVAKYAEAIVLPIHHDKRQGFKTYNHIITHKETYYKCLKSQVCNINNDS